MFLGNILWSTESQCNNVFLIHIFEMFPYGSVYFLLVLKSLQAVTNISVNTIIGSS